MKKIVSALLLSAAISTPAFAAAPGGFIGADFGPATFSGASFGGFASNVNFPNPGSIHLNGGYHFTPNMSVEGGLVIVGNSTVNSSLGAFTMSETLKTSVYYAAAVGTLPVAPQFDVFGKLGLASTKIDYTGSSNFGFAMSASASKTNLMFGLGGQYNINPNVGVRVQYQNFGKADFAAGTFAVGTTSVGLSTFTVGAVYNF